MRPDRVVIGVESERGEALLRELYRPLNLIETPILKTGLESADLIKYASNAFLATKVSFINEVSMLCEAVGADVHAVARGMGLNNRIGRNLHPDPVMGAPVSPRIPRRWCGSPKNTVCRAASWRRSSRSTRHKRRA